MKPSENYSTHKNAASRIAALFLELLERPFPVESTARPLELKTAQDFAGRLSVHINHLNRSVKEVTGKPTTALIAARLITEAKALLQHTDWSVADIAYALGLAIPLTSTTTSNGLPARCRRLFVCQSFEILTNPFEHRYQMPTG